jgi:hypothetical protein
MVCPVCEKQHVYSSAFLSSLPGPARRALEREGIVSEEILSTWKEKNILLLHGIGKSSVPKLNEALRKKGLMFKS